MQIHADDNILVRLPHALQSEAYVVKVGAASISANVIISHGKTLDEVEKEIKDNNIKGIVFEPTLLLGYKQDLVIDALNKLIPELATTSNGARVKSAKFPSLAALIQTNFYSYPGVFKFRVAIILRRAC